MQTNSLSDEELFATLKNLAREHRRIVVGLLVHLGVVEDRRLHLAYGCSSMFDFCVRKLGFSAGEAFLRLTAARLVKRFPRILHTLAAGRMHLTNVMLLRDLFTEDNVDALIEEASGKSKREVKKIVARLRPRPDVRSSMRQLAISPADSAEACSESASAWGGPSGSPRGGSPGVGKRGSATPLSPERWHFEFTSTESVRLKLDRLLDLMSHRNPTREYGPAIELGLDLALAMLEKERLAKTDRPQNGKRSAAPDRISAATRREVVARDGAQCTFVGTDGSRCGSRAFLELDHVQPKALGGTSEASNLEPLCRAHNRYRAEQVFGRAHVEAKIAERRERRKRTQHVAPLDERGPDHASQLKSSAAPPPVRGGPTPRATKPRRSAHVRHRADVTTGEAERPRAPAGASS